MDQEAYVLNRPSPQLASSALALEDLVSWPLFSHILISLSKTQDKEIRGSIVPFKTSTGGP